MFFLKKLILLGGNFESIPTILEAKKEFKVIVVDKNPTAPGFKHTSLKIFESIFDYKAIIKILKKNGMLKFPEFYVPPQMHP